MASKASSAVQTQTVSSISDQTVPQYVTLTHTFLSSMGIHRPVPQSCETIGFFSHFFGSFIKVNQIKRGQISCTITVKPPIINAFETLHGGSAASLIELLSIACARTVIAEDKELFLGEISVSYLSAVPVNEEVIAEASVVKSGRNVTMVVLEFKLKKTGNLTYIAHVTFYNTPAAKL